MDGLEDRIKRDAVKTVKQCRFDLMALTGRMIALESEDSTGADSYSAVALSLKQVLTRLEQVIAVAVKMQFREISGIRPELN